MKHCMTPVMISSLVIIGLYSLIMSQTTHFTFTSVTGNNMTVVVKTSINPTINGSPIATGDEIGVFTPSGLCVGASAWTGNNIAITVWGDDDQTTDTVDGMTANETLHFRLWDSAVDIEYVAAVTYESGPDSFKVDAISVLDTLYSVSPPEITVDPVSQDKYVGEDVTFFVGCTGTPPFTFQWLKDGTPISGETDSILTLTSLVLGDAGDYSCIATNSAGSDTSAEATLGVTIRPAITVTSPNGGDVLIVSTTHAITWVCEGTVGNVKIQYSTDNGSNWTEIISSTENDSSYDWTVPNDVSTTCLVSVSELDGEPSDTSGVFEIEPYPTIIVTYPDGGETLYIGSTVDITWTTEGTVGNVTIEFTSDNGSTWDTVIVNTANDSTHTWTVPEVVSSECKIRISETTDGDPVDESNATFTIAYQQQSISLPAGWNMISCNLDPVNDSVSVIYDDIGSLALVKNNAGEAYMPDYSIDDIGTITITEGYKVYLTVTDALIVSGIAVDVSTTSVSLAQGWNMMAYLPQDAMAIETALADITGDLTLVKDIDGNVYSPYYGIYDQLTDMNPGQGYKVHMQDAASFNYPSSSTLKRSSSSHTTRKQTVHFTFTARTGNNMTVIVPVASNPCVAGLTLEENDEIGVFTPAGLCVGGGVWRGTNSALTVWGDDDQTGPVDGIKAGEMLHYRLWDASTGQEHVASVAYTTGSMEYAVDGIAVVSELKSAGQVAIIHEEDQVLTPDMQLCITPSILLSTSNEKVVLTITSQKGLTDIRLTIYDPLGNTVYKGTRKSALPDSHGVITIGEWNGRNLNGAKVGSGSYLVVVTSIADQGERKCLRSFVGVKD